MNQPFHYNAIKLLSERAGLLENESHLLATSSQYTDDATEHKGILIHNIPDIATHRIDQQGLFQPTCTAHKGIQFISAMNKAVQRKVYISFHFIPPEKNRYMVETPGLIAKELVTNAISQFDNTNRASSLIRLGIALHSYADTWAHNNFSGRHNNENDVEDISTFDNDSWRKLSLYEQSLLNILPSIGHAEADNYPDNPKLLWKYRKSCKKSFAVCNNIGIFLSAAHDIYLLLTSLSNASSSPFDDIRQEVIEGLLHDNWKISLRYSANEFRSQSLTGQHIHWDAYTKPEEFATLSYTATDNLQWFWFHVHANAQRNFVLQFVNEDLM